MLSSRVPRSRLPLPQSFVGLDLPFWGFIGKDGRGRKLPRASSWTQISWNLESGRFWGYGDGLYMCFAAWKVVSGELVIRSLLAFDILCYRAVRSILSYHPGRLLRVRSMATLAYARGNCRSVHELTPTESSRRARPLDPFAPQERVCFSRAEW